jgi:HD-GYP domain-containing protein (c-di-GMP phosphodiesterase class II)
MQHGTIKFDCNEFMSHPPYQTIFADQKESDTVMDLMEEVHVNAAVLESLDYFKTNDFYTYCHTLMVSILSSLLAQRLLPVSIDALKAIMTGPSHDLGKTCIPLHILKKTEPLTHSERIMLEHHAPAGFTLLVYYLRNSLDINAIVARDHHERRDGSGYPLGTICLIA